MVEIYRLSLMQEALREMNPPSLFLTMNPSFFFLARSPPLEKSPVVVEKLRFVRVIFLTYLSLHLPVAASRAM